MGFYFIIVINMSIHHQCASLLAQLTIDLKQCNLWSNETPSMDQLSSTEPFAVDTLRFEQWLQFIFIPKMTDLVNNKTNLPSNMNIYPMADESLKHKNKTITPLLATIKSLDQLISRGE
ncbi:YqcC family protein [Psychrosphaera sp. F3M07]|uniref:YqcC family protein n=1 Tax=Psychrosphaera sp. F3M07 TaxID=2841560 RepID=UPI001C0A6299|nr:YqcC family protein [Psychrosphaera sp. F3M07]MBU2917707.1 YqcC family protein [Psychrosphaera sp. F3M07]